MKLWWQQWPKRLGSELRQLKQAGISYKLDRESFKNGAGVLHLTFEEGPYAGLNLTARFPDIYPYTRFEIFCEEIELAYHQHPFAKCLCLIGRSSENWHTSDSIASFLSERLPDVMTAGQALDVESLSPEVEEDPQGEPFSDYYTYQPDAIVITNSSMAIPAESKCGYLEVGYMRQNDESQFTLLRILDEEKQILAENEAECFQKKFLGKIEGKWVRRDSPVNADEPSLFWQTIKAENTFLDTTPKSKMNGKTFMTMVGVVFPEEYSLRKKQDGWVFLVRQFQNSPKKYREFNEFNALVRPGYAGRADMAQRVPFFNLLQQKKIAVFGTGCLGAPSVLELARCGVGEIRMLDHDFFDPGTAVRWPFGMEAAGQLKVVYLARFLRENYPYTKTSHVVHRLGITSLAAQKEKTDLDVLNDFLEGVDMIYDATTELGLQHLFSDLAAERNIPYVGISTTHGAWGGIVIRICPQNTSGCWGCYRHFFTENEDVRPLVDESGMVQPKGCGDVTYVGAGFDAQQIALGGVRAAVSTLTQDSEGGYPALNWDLSVLHLREKDSSPIPPIWKTFKIEPHPKCRCAK